MQAALCCLTGVIVCAWSCTRDFVRSSHFMSEAYAWFGAAYFFYDIWSMYKVKITRLVVLRISGCRGPPRLKDPRFWDTVKVGEV